MASPPISATAAAPSRWPTIAAAVALVGSALVVAAGPLIAGGFPHRIGLLLFALGGVVAGLAGIACIIALLMKRGPRVLLAVAAVAGVIAGLVIAAVIVDAGKYPRIHDISTDTANPPQFLAVLADREGAENTAAYPGEVVAAQQRVAYPDLAGVILPEPMPQAFDRALAATREMGWRVVLADAAAGRIEAVATVPWWGFKDDVVVRVRAVSGGSRVDVRSKSRVGEGDIGVNAARIRDYLGRLR